MPYTSNGPLQQVEDDGDEAYTRTYNCAMLVNMAGEQYGVETELYNSRAHSEIGYWDLVPTYSQGFEHVSGDMTVQFI